MSISKYIPIPGTSPFFVNTFEDIEGVKRKDQIIISGFSVFSTLDDKSIAEFAMPYSKKEGQRYNINGQILFALDPRATAKKSMASKKGKAEAVSKLHMLIDAKVLKKLQNKNIYFSHDCYLRYGMAKKGRLVFIGGFASEHSSNLEIFIFNDGALISVEEASLPSINDPDFYSQTHETLRKLREEEPETLIEACAPLEFLNDAQFKKYHIDFIENKPFAWLYFKPFNQQSTSASAKLIMKASVLSMTAGVGAFAGMGYLGWMDYQSAVNEYKSSIVGYEQDYSNNANLIEMLEKQEAFMKAGNPDYERLMKYESAVAITSNLQNAFIKRTEFLGSLDSAFRTPGKTDVEHDFKINLVIQKNADLSAGQHAELILTEISKNMPVDTLVSPNQRSLTVDAGAAKIESWNIEISGKTCEDCKTNDSVENDPLLGLDNFDEIQG